MAILPDKLTGGGSNTPSKLRPVSTGWPSRSESIELPGLPEEGRRFRLDCGRRDEKLLPLLRGAAEWQPTAEPWPEQPERFEERSLPGFPAHVLPAVLREWVEAESHATQTPPDLAGLLALAVCSSVIARRVVVEPRPGWREPTNLFVAVCWGPATVSSFSDALEPLREIEAELVERDRGEVTRALCERRQAEARL